MVASCVYTHPRIGRIRVRVVATAKVVRARWEGQELFVTVPSHYPLFLYERFIEAKADILIEAKPAPAFAIGDIIDGHPVDFTIRAEADALIGGRGILFARDLENAPLRGKTVNYYLSVAQSLVDDGIEHPATQNLINKALLKAAEAATRTYLLPIARAIAESIGCEPAGWDVKYRKRILGTCSRNRIVTLGPQLIFLPPHLRDFVILHELSHLSQMNHSPAFHAVCDKYCKGHEAELNKELKRFRFPVR